MPTFGCIITVEFDHEVEGIITGVGGSEIVFIHTEDSAKAKRLACLKIQTQIEQWSDTKNIVTAIESIKEVSFWALVSRKKSYYWRLHEPNSNREKINAIKRTKKSNRYFS